MGARFSTNFTKCSAGIGWRRNSPAHGNTAATQFIHLCRRFNAFSDNIKVHVPGEFNKAVNDSPEASLMPTLSMKSLSIFIILTPSFNK